MKQPLPDEPTWHDLIRIPPDDPVVEKYKTVTIILNHEDDLLTPLHMIDFDDPRTFIDLKFVQDNKEHFIGMCKMKRLLLNLDRYDRYLQGRYLGWSGVPKNTELLLKLINMLGTVIQAYSYTFGYEWQTLKNHTVAIFGSAGIDGIEVTCHHYYGIFCAAEKRLLAYSEQLAMLELYPEPMPGYVYLYGPIEGYHKIGLSVDPSRRSNEFVPKTILPIKAAMLHQFPTNHMKAAEDILHERYEDKRGDGEWFNLDADDINAICAIGSMHFDWLTATTATPAPPSRTEDVACEARISRL